MEDELALSTDLRAFHVPHPTYFKFHDILSTRRLSPHDKKTFSKRQRIICFNPTARFDRSDDFAAAHRYSGRLSTQTGFTMGQRGTRRKAQATTIRKAGLI